MIAKKDTALHLSSGKNISHRLAVPHPHPHRFSTSTAYSSSAQHLLADSPTTDSSGPVLTSSSSHNIKALTSRSSDTRALLGISAIQKRSLQAVEQKMLKMATRARNNYQRKVEATGNKQKYFKVRILFYIFIPSYQPYILVVIHPLSPFLAPSHKRIYSDKFYFPLIISIIFLHSSSLELIC